MRARLFASSASTLAAIGLLTGAGCERSNAVTTDAGALVCTVEAPTACPDPAPHYPDIQPIIQRTCVPCHNGMVGGPWPLLQYSHVADWQDVIRAFVLDCSMPPPDAGVPMSDEERTAILTWILCGFQE